MPPPSHYELLGLPVRFTIDTGALESAYRELLAQVHPDRYAGDTPAAQRESLSRATLVNDAYRTLKGPASRARYLLELRGWNVEGNTVLPPEFLMQQMEWRETLADAQAARHLEALESLHDEIAGAAGKLRQRLAVELDERDDLAAANSAVQQLIFLEKTLAAVNDACAALEQ